MHSNDTIPTIRISNPNLERKEIFSQIKLYNYEHFYWDLNCTKNLSFEIVYLMKIILIIAFQICNKSRYYFLQMNGMKIKSDTTCSQTTV